MILHNKEKLLINRDNNLNIKIVLNYVYVYYLVVYRDVSKMLVLFR